MNNSTTQTLFAYWNEARRGRPAPHRFDIEPARLSGILPQAFILEHTTAGQYTFRLAGTRICEQFGRELRTTSFPDFWSRNDRQRIIESLDSVRIESSVCFATFEVFAVTPPPAAFELILLPLTLDHKINHRFLGAISCANAPSWLAYEAPTMIKIQSIANYSPDAVDTMLRNMDKRAGKTPPKYRTISATTPQADLRQRQFRVIEGGLSDRPIRPQS